MNFVQSDNVIFIPLTEGGVFNHQRRLFIYIVDDKPFDIMFLVHLDTLYGAL